MFSAFCRRALFLGIPSGSDSKPSSVAACTSSARPDSGTGSSSGADCRTGPESPNSRGIAPWSRIRAFHDFFARIGYNAVRPCQEDVPGSNGVAREVSKGRGLSKEPPVNPVRPGRERSGTVSCVSSSSAWPKACRTRVRAGRSRVHGIFNHLRRRRAR